MKPSEKQSEALAALFEELPWGDTAGALRVVDGGLKFALDLTADEFRLWHDHIEPLGCEDEFDRTLVSRLPPEWKFALVARLLRSIAMSHGISTDYAGGPNGVPCLGEAHAATPTRRMLEILHNPALQG